MSELRMPLRDYNAMQMLEMDKHKWIESEKAGHDLGEGCYLDWIKKHSATFRKEVLSQGFIL